MRVGLHPFYLRYTPVLRLGLIGLLGSLVLLTGCGKREKDQPVPVPATTTTISGNVNARDEILNVVSLADVAVALEGTFISAMTVATGAYRLAGVPVGRYVLNLSRPGLGTMRYEAPVAKPEPLNFPLISLDQPTSTQALRLDPITKAGQVDVAAAYVCTLSFSPQLYGPGKRYAVAVFTGKTATVGTTEYVDTYKLTGQESTPPPTVRGQDKFEVTFSKAELRRLGFSSGDKVYAAVYGAPVALSDGGIGREAYYFEPYSLDPVTKQVKLVNANLSSTPVRVSFTMP